MPHNTEEIRHTNKSIYNLERENQLFPLMITGGEKWHYLAVEKLPTLLRGITSKQEGDFVCLNCRTKNKLKKIKMHAKIIIIAMWKCLKKIIKY